MLKMLRDFWDKIERITYHEEDEATVVPRQDECQLLRDQLWESIGDLRFDHHALADAVHGIHGTVNVDAERIRQLEITQASLIEFIDRMIDAKNAEIRVLARIETKPTRVDLEGLFKAVGAKTDGKQHPTERGNEAHASDSRGAEEVGGGESGEREKAGVD